MVLTRVAESIPRNAPHPPHNQVFLGIRAELPGVLGAQATTGTNHPSRSRKPLSNATLRIRLAAGNRAEGWSWAKDYRGRWTYRCAAIRLADLEDVALEEPPWPWRPRQKPEPTLFDNAE